MTAARAGTETAACNMALRRIGRPPIADIAEDTTRARACRSAFGNVRDLTLRKKAWNFCSTWASPSAEVAEDLGPLKTRYRMPSDCVRVNAIDGLEADEWAVVSADGAETMVVATNATAPLINYNKRIESPALWDAEFLHAFAAYLAAEIAPDLAKSVNVRAKIADEADTELNAAARSDAREKAPTTISSDTSILRARRGIRSWR